MTDKHELTRKDTQKAKKSIAAKTKKSQVQLLFTIMEGHDSDFGKIYAMEKNKILIGRGQGVDIALDDEKISREHCCIEILPSQDIEHIVITDLKSTNGTTVNGEIVDHCTLHSGDRIGVGDTLLRFNHNDEIEEKYHSRLFSMATTDPLTGLFNKRYILNELDNQFKIAKRYQRTFSVLMIDVDLFKSINDTYGHLAGDECLKMLAFSINRLLREQDIFGRFGGEEFLIILPETQWKGAVVLAERLREKVASLELAFHQHLIHVTVSVGIAQMHARGETWRNLLERADEALYNAKKQGRNCIKIAKSDET